VVTHNFPLSNGGLSQISPLHIIATSHLIAASQFKNLKNLKLTLKLKNLKLKETMKQERAHG
jgi:hypothetical protein